MSKTMGWDIGGAHLKAVLLEDAKVVQALQIPCELWRGLDKLEAALNKALGVFDVKDVQHAVTMTGELVDLFANRREGVIAISRTVSNLLGKNTQFYAAELGFIGIEGVAAHTAYIASANWHASASWLAKHAPEALFVDIGSTTTDIIPIVGGKVDSSTDALRLQNETLIYTGVVRTPVMALAQKLLFEGVETNVAAEYFATMADVYRLTGDLKLDNDMAETADGKGKTALESARRLARMVGHDAEDKPIETWKNLAFECKKIQMQHIKQAVLKHSKDSNAMIGAGTGAFLAKQLASELKHEYLSVSQALSIELDENLEVCFPAYAVARLLEQC